MSNRRACLTGVYLAGVWLIGVRLKPPSHTGRHCVGWHAVMCYGAPEWFRQLAPELDVPKASLGREGGRVGLKRTPRSPPGYFGAGTIDR
jgi:hypothetical protein